MKEDYLTKIKEEAHLIRTSDDVERLYKDYYKKYIYDPLYGFIDQSNTIDIIKYRGGGDCDDMAEVFRWLLSNYYYNKCNDPERIKKSVKIYAFFPITKHIIKAFKNCHVMCVVDRCTLNFAERPRWLLGDYGFYYYDSVDEVKQHYIDRFFDSKDNIKIDDIVIVEVPSVDFLKLLV